MTGRRDFIGHCGSRIVAPITTQIVCSKVAAILLCKSASLQQIWHGKSASLKQVNAYELVTTRQTCHKLAASNSLQAIAKAEYENNFGFEPPTYRFLNLSS
ncbi:hypothetical protein AVEN_234898-1 [Araneus ventricosus]|uniref:Uncharacterized protein n=1 Tax=Araneus ventricosus TaxID=182803 RepID=A0A4Y2H9L4_ARAVE|nr:hypothetical protein AVEN_234898-1 [Araneus ventricosus]